MSKLVMNLGAPSDVTLVNCLLFKRTQRGLKRDGFEDIPSRHVVSTTK